MKLTKEDIQFIDTYLDNSDIVFADIRMEMVDHVASGIEAKMSEGDTRDFYFIFKDYMVENKAKLLDDNRKFLKSADKKIWKALLKELVKPITLIVFLICCIGFYAMFKFIERDLFLLIISLIPFIGIFAFAFTSIFFGKINKRKRFSVVERLALPFIAFYYVTNFAFNFTTNTEASQNIIWLIGSVSLALAFIFILIRVSLKLFKTYNERFKHI